jgi:hypothetical protein
MAQLKVISDGEWDTTVRRQRNSNVVQQRAMRIMFGYERALTGAWFSGEAMQWLAKTWGDLRTEYLAHDGWCVGSCYLDARTDGFRARTLDLALARAVVGHKRVLKAKGGRP